MTTPRRRGTVASILTSVLLLGCGKSGPVAESHRALDARPDLPIFHESYVFIDLAAESKGTVADTGVFAQGSWVASAGGGRLVFADNASIVICKRSDQAGGAAGGVCEIFYAIVNPPIGMVQHDSFEVER